MAGSFHIQVTMFLHGDFQQGTSISLFGETKDDAAKRLTGVIQQITVVGWYSSHVDHMTRLVPPPIGHKLYSSFGFSSDELAEIANEAIRQVVMMVKR